MCDGCGPAALTGPERGWSRRRVLGLGLAAGAALGLPARTVAAQGAELLPRSAWAGDLPAGPIAAEPDVRTLVVHHTVDDNGYGPDDVVPLLRRIHAFHTGPEKGWPDVAYNFFVDRYGRVWEGRAGSLAGPVAGDATGGNQGSDQKCAFLGDHRTEPPTPEAAEAMARLLALLADRHGIDTAAGATTSFTSRGSNLHPAGTTVTVGTITGHRSVSQTACPGDAAMALVTDVLPGAVAARRTTPPVTAPATTAPPMTAPPPTATSNPATSEQLEAHRSPLTSVAGDTRRSGPDPLPVGVAAVAAAGAGLLALRARRIGR